MSGAVAVAEERRKSNLTDSDFEKIGEAFDKRLTSFCEVIGYDVSTPDSRTEIRRDHEFVRSARNWKTWLVVTILGGVASAAIAAVVGG